MKTYSAHSSLGNEWHVLFITDQFVFGCKWCRLDQCLSLYMNSVMQDRREQARQDLKGLEETVVSAWTSNLPFYLFLCMLIGSQCNLYMYVLLSCPGEGAADSSQLEKTVRAGSGNSGQEGKAQWLHTISTILILLWDSVRRGIFSF